jgi:hypothetical protein
MKEKKTTVTPIAELDIEARSGFWGECDQKFDTNTSYTAYSKDEKTGKNHGNKRSPFCSRFMDALALTCYGLLVVALVLNLDIFASRLGFGVGIVDWKEYNVLSSSTANDEVSHDLFYDSIRLIM